MSNSINMKHRRKRAIETFKGRGGGPTNDCMKPSRGASKADLGEFHRESLRSRRRRQLARVTNVRQRRSGSIATGNRNIRNIRTAEPAAHEHKREIARNLRRRNHA